MLLKKQEKDDKVKSMYSSSTICASIYDKKTNNLTVIFSKGGQYVYEGVSLTDYTRFEVADSQGIVLNSHIKKYPFTKLDNVDTAAIIAEITTIKATEDKVKLDYAVKTLIDKFNAVVTYYSTTDGIESGLLTKAKEAIAEYDKVVAPQLDKVNG